MSSARRIGDHMTPLAYSVGDDLSVADAALRMQELGVRHLPVMRGSRLVGIVSERDLAVLEAISGAHPSTLRVSDAMTHEPYTVGPEASLREVAQRMADDKLGSVLVVDDDEVKGIFTTVDALNLLAQRLD